MTRNWVDGSAPYLSAANLQGMENDITSALGVPDGALASRINDPGSQAAAALNATYALKSTDVPKWQPTTAYTAGQQVISPAGDIVSAISSFTSGASYSAANWAYVRFADYFFNVKAYGAKGDGTTDDSAAIQAAINAANNGGGIAANTSGGGVVWFPTGTFIVGTTLTLYGGVHLRGTGPGGSVFSNVDAALPFRGTVIKLKSGANQDLIRSANFAALTGTSSPSAYATPNRFGIYDMVLDGNKAGNSSGDVLKIFGASFWLQNLVIQNGAGRGLYTEYGSAAGYDNEAQINNLRITDNVSDGWLFKGPHDSLITNVFSSRNGGSGFISAGSAGSLAVTNMHNWGNSVYNFDIGTTDATFVNCVMDGTGANGVGMRITAASIRWLGGSIYGTNTQGETLIQLGDGSTAFTATGLDFHTRFWNMALGSVIIGYSSNVTLGYNVWRGMINNGTNSRFYCGNARAKVVGAQTLPVTTLTVDSTAGFPTSGSLYTAGGTISYTGTTSTTFTGVSGGAAVTLADQSHILQSATLGIGNETYEFRSADGNALQGLLQMSGLSSQNIIENVGRQQIGALNVRNVMTVRQTLSSNGAVTMDTSNGNSAIITLQANATSSTIVNPTQNQELTITWIQDATGGRTYSWPANCKFVGGSAPSDTTASKRTSVRFSYESSSSSWFETARSVAVG